MSTNFICSSCSNDLTIATKSIREVIPVFYYYIHFKYVNIVANRDKNILLN